MFLKSKRISRSELCIQSIICSLPSILSHRPPTFLIHLPLPPSVSVLAPKEICFKPSVSQRNTCLFESLVRRSRSMWGHNRPITGANPSFFLSFPPLLLSSIQMPELRNCQYTVALRDKENQLLMLLQGHRRKWNRTGEENGRFSLLHLFSSLVVLVPRREQHHVHVRPHFLFQLRSLAPQRLCSAAEVKIVRDPSRMLGGCDGAACMNKQDKRAETLFQLCHCSFGREANCFPYKACNSLVPAVAQTSVWVRLTEELFIQYAHKWT